MSSCLISLTLWFLNITSLSGDRDLAEKIMLVYNKNYVLLALKYILKNLKEMISALEIKKRYRNNNIE